MVNGILIPSDRTWSGTVVVGVSATGIFEIFPRNGAWAALFSKLLLRAFSTSHEYVEDTKTLTVGEQQSVIQNGHSLKAKHDTEWLRKPKVAVVSVSNLGEHYSDSPLKHRQVPNIKVI